MTKKPRIIVTLEEADYALVKKVAEAQDMSMSALMRDYVEMSRPMLQHLADLVDAFEQAAADRREVHMVAVDQAIVKGQTLHDLATGQLPLAVDWLESFTQMLNGNGVEATGGEGEGSVVDTTPTPCNTGVRSQIGTPPEEKEEKKENKKKVKK